MAGLLTGAGDFTSTNSGAGTGTSRPFTLPANAVDGELLFAIVVNGNNASGRNQTCSTSGNAWTKLCDLRFANPTTSVAGAVWFRTITAAELAANSGTATITTSTVRWAINVFRTSGFDAAQLAAVAPLTTADVYTAAASTSVLFNGLSAAPAASVLLRIAALNFTAPTADPFSATTPAAGMTTAVQSSGYSAGVATLTSAWIGQREVAAGAATANGTFTWTSPGVTARAIAYNLLIPVLVRGSSATTTTVSDSIVTGTARRTGAVTATSVSGAVVTGRSARRGATTTTTASSSVVAGRSARRGSAQTSSASSSVVTGASGRRSSVTTVTASSGLVTGGSARTSSATSVTVSDSLVSGSRVVDDRSTTDWTIGVTVLEDPWNVAVRDDPWAIAVQPPTLTITALEV